MIKKLRNAHNLIIATFWLDAHDDATNATISAIRGDKKWYFPIYVELSGMLVLRVTMSQIRRLVAVD